MPPELQELLLDDYANASIGIELLNTACEYPVYLDNLRFTGELTPRTIFHVSGSEGVDVVSQSVLSFDEASDWIAIHGDVGQAASEYVRDGTGALAVTDPDGFILLESRAFAGGELGEATSQLSLDIYIPSQQVFADVEEWYGDLELSLACPGAGFDRWLGHRSLKYLYWDDFSQLVFDLEPVVVRTLNDSRNKDCFFRIAPQSRRESGTFVLERGGFIQ